MSIHCLKVCTWVVMLFSIVGFNSPAVSQRPLKPEIRGFWADGFGEGFKTPEQVDTLIRRLQVAHCNAIFAQMRKGGDANYLSRYEPWAFDNTTHFDSLAYLIAKAHACKPRIQVHAWLNTCAVGKSHGNPHHIAIAHPEYKSLSDTGEDYDNEATKIDPGNPEAADWTARVYLDVARRYDVDGIHFDFVRYGSTDGKGRFGYNPVSVARYNARYGKTGQPEWTDPLWKQWRRDQVTALVRKVYLMSTAIKPKLTVSAATITWLEGPHDSPGIKARQFWNDTSSPMNRVFQDWRSWMEEGIIDLNCQMSYYSEVKHPDWYRQWIDWGKDNQYRRWVVPSSGVWLNSISDSFQQIAAIRKPSGRKKVPAGVLLYSYSGTNAGPDGKEQSYNEDFYSALGSPSSYSAEPPFAGEVEFPPLPWKEMPKSGHIKGFVLAGDGFAPIDGIKVTLRGPKGREQKADGTGFFGFVDLPAGNYDVSVEGNGFSKQLSKVNVEAGRVSQCDFLLGQAGSPIIDAGQIQTCRPIWMSLLPNSPVRFRNAFVLLGTDTMPGRLLVRLDAGPVLMVNLKTVLQLPIVTGDVVSLQGKVIVDSLGRSLEATSVAVTDAKIPEDMDGAGNIRPSNPSSFLPTRVTIAGYISNRKNGSFMLTDEVGTVFQVLTEGRKGIGVESPIEDWRAPDGLKLQVFGYVGDSARPGPFSYSVYPIDKNSMKTEDFTALEKLKRTAGWSVCIFRATRINHLALSPKKVD